MAIPELAYARPRSNRETPNVLLAPSPLDRNTVISLRADPVTIRQFADSNLNAKLGEYCGLVHGNVLEFQNGEAVTGGTDGLMAAHALYRGIKRPKKLDGRDEQMLVYVTNPPYSYIYPSRADPGPSICKKPAKSVFVTYAELFPQPELDERSKVQIHGLVQFWEWVLADDVDPALPENYAGRYFQPVW